MKVRQLAVAVALSPLLATAAETLEVAAYTTEEDFFQSIPIVLTATRLAQSPADAPSSITVIDQEMIRASGAQELADVLRLVPGFQVAYFFGSTSVVGVHGFVGNWQRRMQVLVDGRSVYLPLLSTVDWGSLGVELSDIDRIEVVRGSNSPAYGANAFMGVISIITKQAFHMRGAHFSVAKGSNTANDATRGSLSDKQAALDRNRLNLRYGDSFKNVDYVVSLGYNADDGFRGFYDSKETKNIGIRANSSLTAYDSIDLALGYTNVVAGVPESHIDLLEPAHDKTTKTSYQSVAWNHVDTPNMEWRVSAYHNRFDLRNLLDLGKLSYVLNNLNATDPNDVNPWDASLISGLYGIADDNVYLGYDGLGERYDVEFQVTNIWNTSLRSVAGFGARLDTMRSFNMLGSNALLDENSFRAFGNLEWRLGEWLVTNAGVMAENTDVSGTYVSPRLAFNGHINEKNSLRLSLTRSYRLPSILENNILLTAHYADGTILDHQTVSDGDLKAEQMTDIEVAYMLLLPSRRTSLEVKGFREWIRDGILDLTDHQYIASTPFDTANGIPEASVWSNVTRANIKGYEIQLRMAPVKDLSLWVNYAYAECEDCTQIRHRNPVDQSDIDGTVRSLNNSVPQHTFSSMAKIDLPRQFDLSAVYYHVAKMEWLEDGQLVPEYDRIDARIAKRSNWSRLQIDWALVLQNLNGKRYAEFENDTLFERRGIFSATIEY